MCHWPSRRGKRASKPKIKKGFVLESLEGNPKARKVEDGVRLSTAFSPVQPP